MGIVNVTPDSFSDGGLHADAEAAVLHALSLLDEGASIVDIGGESTRPGAHGVASDEEIRRVIPVIQGILAARPEARISVDTAKADVAVAAIGAGASIVNDVAALGDPGMAEACARTGVIVVLMHMRGDPRTMQHDTRYGDLVGEVAAFLRQRAERAMAAGIPHDRIWIDPGLGFGKAGRDNPRLIAAVPVLRELGFPVLIGASRKSFIGAITGERQADRRVYGSIGAALAAARLGADVLRVHDVRATREALEVYQAIDAETRP